MKPMKTMKIIKPMKTMKTMKPIKTVASGYFADLDDDTDYDFLTSNITKIKQKDIEGRQKCLNLMRSVFFI